MCSAVIVGFDSSSPHQKPSGDCRRRRCATRSRASRASSRTDDPWTVPVVTSAAASPPPASGQGPGSRGPRAVAPSGTTPPRRRGLRAPAIEASRARTARDPSTNIRLRAMSAPSSGARGSRPSIRPSMISSTAATAVATACGRRNRGRRRRCSPARRGSAQRHVLVAQDVAPPRRAARAPGGARRHVADVHQVQAGVDVGRHPSGEEVGHDPAGWGRRVVARAHGRGRVHHHDVAPIRRRRGRQALRRHLRSLVRADHLRRRLGVSSSPGLPSAGRPTVATDDVWTTGTPSCAAA